MPNKLAGEKSPYLLQHSENPVDWFPWGEEAFRKAALEQKPIFLSIGYSTCHWCHVMEHESFEDMEVAAVLNSHFVSIKVDREERPDIDQVYMTVCQATTGGGGWPLSIFISPDRQPFFAGTYFPKTSRLGALGFLDILHRVAHLWSTQREQLDRISDEIIRAIQRTTRMESQELGLDTLERAYRQLKQTFDPVWGGFGSAPKFPTPHNLSFLLRWQKRNPSSEAAGMVERTLRSMRSGGIFDQIGFGFHRYSVDEKWLVPHFEKMLYDQALLALTYTDAFLATGEADYSRVVSEIFDYVAREMRSPEGGFYSAEDADSEGREGLFYVWTPDQTRMVLGGDTGEIVNRVYGITSAGNFEDGLSIPHLPKRLGDVCTEVGMMLPELKDLLEESRKKLFSVREERPHPFKDDKILLAWNGLMIAALARGARALLNKTYAKLASEAAEFIIGRMRNKDGRLFRRYRHGELAYPAYADDYAFLIWGLVELYQTVFEEKYLAEAVRFQDEMFNLFGDLEGGGFYYTGSDAEKLILREKPIYDGAIPSANSVAASNLLRLGRMVGNIEWERQAHQLFRSFANQVSPLPPAYTHLLHALDFALGPSTEIVIAGDPDAKLTGEMITAVNQLFLPNALVMLKKKGQAGIELSALVPATEQIEAQAGTAVAYVCENFRCRQPITGCAELEAAVRQQ